MSELKRDVLDYGEIELLSAMGSDTEILSSARVSTGVEADPFRDKGLMNYLMRNDHHTPFETVNFKFRVKAPIAVARQWFRHRISSFNEKSARYCEFEEFECYVPDKFRKQSETNRQGSESHLDPFATGSAIHHLMEAYHTCENSYEALLKLGVAKEQARLVMPVGIYTEWIWTVNFRSLMNFLELRQHPHAQQEIRVFADAIHSLVKQYNKIPMALDAFDDQRKAKEAFRKINNKLKDGKKVYELLDWAEEYCEELR